jgi:hypothetical protein
MMEHPKAHEIVLPAGEAREDEREIEKIADRIENSEPLPARVHEAAVVPMTATGEDGTRKTIVAPDGSPVGMRGEVVTTLSALEARHEEMRRVKPCISCAHSYFPNPKSDAGREIAAHVSMGHKLFIIPPLETAAEYMHCRAWDKCVHASQHCLPSWGPDRHVFRRGWLTTVKAWIARRRMERSPS